MIYDLEYHSFVIPAQTSLNTYHISLCFLMQEKL